MAVSDKMAIVIKDYIEWLMGIAFPDSEAEITQSIINAAWTDFDPVDESTYPKEDKEYLVEDCGHLYFARCAKDMDIWYTGEENLVNVIRYADPEHFRYEG